jgi:hypothetical protein
VDAVRIRNWLRQFVDDASIFAAFKILQRGKERYYFDSPRVRQAIDDAYKWLIEKMNEAHVELMYGASDGSIKGDPRARPGGRILNVHIASLGPAGKSGADIAREFKNQKRFQRAASIDEAMAWVTNTAVGRYKKFNLFS